MTRAAVVLLAVAAAALGFAAAPASARIEVHAHRGGAYVERVPTYPENTMPAFRRAAADGFVLELDVKLTRDRVPVVVHDDTFDRTTTCTGPIAAMTAEEVSARCRADVLGSPGNPAGLPVRKVDHPSVRVPTLAEVLAFARDRGARVNVEIKNQPTDNDFDPAPRPAYADAVLDAIDAARIPRSLVLVQSFWPANLDAAEQRGFETSVLTLQPQLRFLGPYVTVCNYWNIFWTFTAEHFTAPDPTGGAQRVLLNNGDDQNDDVTSFGANEPANGKGLGPNPDGIRQYGHINPQGGNAIAPDGTADCTAGQQGYTYGAYRDDPTGPRRFYRRVAADHLNGVVPGAIPAKGPTYDHFDKNGHGVGRGRPRVPKGETFTDIPGGRAALSDFEKAILARRGPSR
jgi:glycerophosphoryl diester phosphodiesterase